MTWNDLFGYITGELHSRITILFVHSLTFLHVCVCACACAFVCVCVLYACLCGCHKVQVATSSQVEKSSINTPASQRRTNTCTEERWHTDREKEKTHYFKEEKETVSSKYDPLSGISLKAERDRHKEQIKDRVTGIKKDVDAALVFLQCSWLRTKQRVWPPPLGSVNSRLEFLCVISCFPLHHSNLSLKHSLCAFFERTLPMCAML